MLVLCLEGSCFKKLHEAKMADMKDCIITLKAEIVKLHVVLDQVKSVEVPRTAKQGSVQQVV